MSAAAFAPIWMGVKAAAPWIMRAANIAALGYPLYPTISEKITGEKAASRLLAREQMETERAGRQDVLAYLSRMAEADRAESQRREGIGLAIQSGEFKEGQRQFDTQANMSRAAMLAQPFEGTTTDTLPLLAQSDQMAQMEINRRVAEGVPINPWLLLGLNVG